MIKEIAGLFFFTNILEKSSGTGPRSMTIGLS